jgi:hypothetical protein
MDAVMICLWMLGELMFLMHVIKIVHAQLVSSRILSLFLTKPLFSRMAPEM